MKIAFNLKFTPQPMGGGNSFLDSLVTGLTAHGHEVYFDLKCDQLDIILILDPRWNHFNCTFTAKDILKYLSNVNNRVIVVHRINECDERKNTNFMNKKLRQVNYLADSTVFVSKWLQELDLVNVNSNHDFDIVIRNGADKSIYNQRNFQAWTGTGPLKLVTHHWSNNLMKGFDIYEKLDLMLGDENYRHKFTFTYIGNLPKKFKFKNSIHIKPLYSHMLAKKIKEHHGYLTASINEPGGNHQNEGAACGLPLLYRDSGSLPEYCENYGIMFNENNFELMLNEFRDRYSHYVKIMKFYPHTFDLVIESYIDYFNALIAQRARILSRDNRSFLNKNLWRLYFPM
jgi:glycosyltransferase involved in cell wall biosynthesis